MKRLEADEVIDRTLSSESVAVCEIPSIREQVDEMKEFKWEE